MLDWFLGIAYISRTGGHIFAATGDFRRIKKTKIIVMRPLVTIAIATKNRVNYCIQAIDSILKYQEDFQLVIQDNTDDTTLKEYVEKNYADTRLVYRYTPPPFSSIDNFNAALELADGEYVCLLGDDDGVTQNFFDAVKWAKANNVDSVCPKEFVHYIWPNESTNGKMVIPYSTHKVWENKPLENLQPLIEDGVVQYMKFNLPKLYHGIVRKACLDKLKEKIGYYLGGLSPDIYASVSLSSVVNRNVILDSPITIAGACPKSTTIDSTKGKHSGKIEDAPHFRSRGNYTWEDRVPGFYAVETILAESALKAIKEHNIPVNIDKLNVEKILAGAINNAPSYEGLFKEETFKTVGKERDTADFNKKVKKYRRSLFVETYSKRIINRIPRKYIFKHYRFTGIKNIDEADRISNQILKPLNITGILNSYKTPVVKKI